MMVTLLVSGLMHVTIATVFAFVGHAVLKRTMDPSQSAPNVAFAVWWFGVAGYTLEAGSRSLLAALGVLDLPLHTTIRFTGFLFLMMGMCGLMFYLLYVYTGNRRALVPLAAFYGAVYLSTIYTHVARRPLLVETRTWVSDIVFAHPENPLMSLTIVAFVFIPIIAAIVLYLLLYKKVDHPLQKKRVLLVGFALLAWFVSSAIAAFAGYRSDALWPIANRGVALVSTLVILYAFTTLERRLTYGTFDGVALSPGPRA